MDPQDFGIDFCGPYVSGGKFQSSVASTHTARTAEEQCCKDHDACYFHASTPSEFVTCDENFTGCNAPLNSFQSSINSGLVNAFGKYFHGSGSKMKRPRTHSIPEYEGQSSTLPYDRGYWTDQCIHDVETYNTPQFAIGTTPDRPVMRRIPQRPLRSRKRLRLGSRDKTGITANLIGHFDSNVSRWRLGRRRRFSRLPRFYRRRIARQKQRSWRIAYARKQRLNWRNNYYRKRVGAASRIQRSFRKFLYRKKLRRNSFKRIRFIGDKYGVRRYYKY